MVRETQESRVSSKIELGGTRTHTKPPKSNCQTWDSLSLLDLQIVIKLNELEKHE